MGHREQNFRDRADAGRQLASRLLDLDASLDDPLVLALPRGGVPVGFEVATALDAELDVFVARKVGAPGRLEYGIGAVAESDASVTNDEAMAALGISADVFERLASAERIELDRRVSTYRAGRPVPSLADREVVVVDDGLATGVTAAAAIAGVRTGQPNRLVLAVPVAAVATAVQLSAQVDDLVAVWTPNNFAAVGQFYDRFDQTTDDEVVELLGRASARIRCRGTGKPPAG